jgi:hypothetical protein
MAVIAIIARCCCVWAVTHAWPAGQPAVIPSHLWRIIARRKLLPSLKI